MAKLEAPMTLGKWVVPYYLIFSLSLLGLILFRFIKKIIRSRREVWWRLSIITFLFTAAYLIFGDLSLFVVYFMFFPFAP
jgi:hypothetical protein